MDEPGIEIFHELCKNLCAKTEGVVRGKMMSSPGLKYNNKVFAFYHKGTMGFRMGPLFNPDNFGLNLAKPLSPFKTKPPLKGWYVIEYEESSLWKDLAEMALEFTQTL